MVVFGCKSVSSLDCYLLLSLLPMSFTFSALFLFIYLFIYFERLEEIEKQKSR